MSLREFWRNRPVRLLAAAALVLGLYAVAGFVAAPRLVRSALLEDIPKTLDATPTVGAIRINPFLLQITVDDFALAGRDGAKLLGFERLFVDFDLSSLWHRAYTFGRIELVAPFVDAAVAADGSLNLMKLERSPPPRTPPQPTSDGAPLPPLRIGSLRISRGSVGYLDRSRAEAFTARLDPVDFELHDFTTGADGGRFMLSGASKRGEHFEWRGHLAVQPIESDGELRIEGLELRTLWEYLEDRLGFVVSSGTVDAGVTYRFAAGNGGAPANLTLDIAQVALRNLGVRPRQGDTDWVALPALDVKGTHVDVAGRRAQVDSVTLTGLKVLGWRAEDGSTNLLELAAPPVTGGPRPASPTPPSAPSGATAAPAPPAAQAEASAPWSYGIRLFQLQDADLSVEDRTVRPALKLRLAPFSLSVKDISEDLGKPVGVALDAHLNGKGSLTAAGSLTPQPAAAELELKLDDLELRDAQPLIARYTAMTLLGGRLGMQGTLRYRSNPQAANPQAASPQAAGSRAASGAPARGNVSALRFTGNITVDGVRTVDDALHDDFVDWDRLEIRGLNYTQGPDRLDIDQVSVRKPYARVMIESDATTNIKRVLTAPGSAAATAPPVAAKAPAVRGNAPASPGSAGAASLPMSIKTVMVADGEAEFSDLSVEPHFAAGIHTLAGNISGLSSKPQARAKVDLKGLVDTFSPVTISGNLNVLGPLYTDLTIAFRNISLPVFNPYSGKFAGYDIAKGKLSTDFHYLVDGRKLDAQHHIVIEQLEFGEKTASKDAVSLPVKLAVALLKDRNGVIDLNIPVTGSLDDPEFRVAPIIWKVVVNLIEKAVTAPFAMLGSLFGGGPELQFIDFEPGAGTLDPAAADKTRAVAKALVERPQIKIELPIGVVREVDAPALVALRFGETIGVRAPETLDPAARLAALTRGYVKLFGAEPKFPEAVAAPGTKPDGVEARIDFLDKTLRERLTVSEEDLKALGQRRAAVLQQALLADPQIDPERVFLVDNDKATVKDGRVRLELSLR
jgi:hypothetical protein